MLFWVLPNSGVGTVSHLTALLSEFSREYPHIKVELAVLTRESLWREIFGFQREPRRSAGADIIQFPHYWTALLVRLGILAELGELDSRLSSVTEWIEPLRPHCLLPGTQQVYSVPWWMDVSALHYRVDHLREVSSNPDEQLARWDGFMEACEALSKLKKGGTYFPLENSNMRGSVTIRDVLPCMWNRGGDIFNSSSTRAVAHRDESLRGMEDFLQLFRKGYMPLMRERGSLGTLLEGKASMTISRRLSQSVLPQGEEPDFEVKTLPVPGELFGSHSYLSSYNLGVARGGKNQQEAVTLLKWLTGTEQQLRYSQMIHAFPPSTAGFERFIFSSHERMRTYSGIVAGARTVPNVMVCGTYMTVLDSTLSRLAMELAKGAWNPALLMQAMVKVQVEMDYLLSLYGE
ncbi:MAG: extracellular solute-binding protein [Elusimicrobiales bacterium]|nr:extracellular solute-binding protein [Elusimicrobiales bacterium]